MADETKKRGTLKDYVYQQVIEMICAGKFKAGEIITEGQIIAIFQVSKSPVREALIQLCYEEVLRNIPRCGYQIIQITAKKIHDLAELRMYLELSSLQKTAGMLTPEILTHLKELLLQLAPTEVEKDLWTAWNDNKRFHQALADCAGNVQVTKALERVLAACTQAYAQVYETNRSAVVIQSDDNFHQKIVKALENHDIYTAHECLKTDILLMEQHLLHIEPSE